jgi:hypothetical protein
VVNRVLGVTHMVVPNASVALALLTKAEAMRLHLDNIYGVKTEVADVLAALVAGRKATPFPPAEPAPAAEPAAPTLPAPARRTAGKAGQRIPDPKRVAAGKQAVATRKRNAAAKAAAAKAAAEAAAGEGEQTPAPAPAKPTSTRRAARAVAPAANNAEAPQPARRRRAAPVVEKKRGQRAFDTRVANRMAAFPGETEEEARAALMKGLTDKAAATRLRKRQEREQAEAPRDVRTGTTRGSQLRRTPRATTAGTGRNKRQKAA